MAGNGGTMADAERELNADNAVSPTSKKNKKKDGESRVKAGRGDGVERLRRAADKVVGQNSEQLANLMIGKALEGELAYTKALVGMAERKRPRPTPVKKPRRPSAAIRLEAEKPWRGEDEEGTGNRDQGTADSE